MPDLAYRDGSKTTVGRNIREDEKHPGNSTPVAHLPPGGSEMGAPVRGRGICPAGLTIAPDALLQRWS